MHRAGASSTETRCADAVVAAHFTSIRPGTAQGDPQTPF
jgi:hypothetical protein